MILIPILLIFTSVTMITYKEPKVPQPTNKEIVREKLDRENGTVNRVR